MDISSGVSLVVGLVACGGVIGTWIKNGRQQAEERGALKKDIESIQKSLNNPNDGLGAISREVSGMKEHCAGVTSRFDQRIMGLEGDRRDRHSQ
jgi:hypothetical protein